MQNRENVLPQCPGTDTPLPGLCLRDDRFLVGGTSHIMGILNVNDDSFYAASRTSSVESALERAGLMLREGASILDIGAESTRPGSRGLSAEAESNALIPVVRRIREIHPDVVLSVDTRKAEVAYAALEAGADIVNDVSGLQLDEERDAMIDLLAAGDAVYVLTHTQGTPETMHLHPHYEDFFEELLGFFDAALVMLTSRGVAKERIVLDPGIGFGKRLADNLEILANLDRFKVFGLPLMIGASRKGFIGKILDGAEPGDRFEGTLAVTAICAANGIDMIRVHDVGPNVRVVRTVETIGGYRHG